MEAQLTNVIMDNEDQYLWEYLVTTTGKEDHIYNVRGLNSKDRK